MLLPLEIAILLAVSFICLIFILKNNIHISKPQEKQSDTIAKDLKVDKIVAWIKNNQAKAAAIGVLIAALAYTQLSKPRTYEDCLLQVVKDAQSDDSANIGRRACRAKFPVDKNRFGSIPTNPYLSKD